MAFQAFVSDFPRTLAEPLPKNRNLRFQFSLSALSELTAVTRAEEVKISGENCSLLVFYASLDQQ